MLDHELAALHQQTQQRVTFAAFGHYGAPYGPLAVRFAAVSNGQGGQAAREQFIADLHEINRAEPETLKRMVMNQAVDVSCHGPAHHAMAAEMRAAGQLRHAAAAVHPQISPAELLARFRARGVKVDLAGDDLHVSPASTLSDGDRTVLRAQKDGLVAALRADVAVI